MRIITTTTTLDGSPSDLADYNAKLQAALSGPNAYAASTEATPSTPEKQEPLPANGGPGQFADAETAQRCLTRIPLSKAQSGVLHELFEAHPAMLPLSKLGKSVGYTDRQMAGLMGSFARRLVHTEGHRDGDNLFNWAWEDDQWVYGLPDSVRTAMVAQKMV